MIASLERLIIFARFPKIGKVKTRLISDIGAESATDIYKQMSEFTLKQARILRLTRNIAIEVWFTGGTKTEMQAWLGSDIDYQIQVGASLGDRLIYALNSVMADGNIAAIVIGTDCPDLDSQILNTGFSQLQSHEIVLGAATDGGYYLIGLKKFIPELFTNIPWSTSEVFTKTLNIVKEQNLSYALLPTLTDVDTAADIAVWDRVKAGNDALSIIIPTLNEAQNLPRTLQALANSENTEVIVVDGGSTDRTIAIAQSIKLKAPIRIISGTSGRANQMNLGASQANGKILLFLHGDTILPPDFDRTIRRILQNSNMLNSNVAGAFALKIEGKGWGLRLVEWGVNWRSQFFQMPYGDQAIFLQADLFLRLNGFVRLPIMEDFELMLRLRKLGKIAIAPLAVMTSPRRWQNLGVVQTTVINQIVIIGFLFGVNPAKLAMLYRNWKNKK